MIKEKLKAFLPLVAGTGFGFLLFKLTTPTFTPFVPKPIYKINLNGGMFILPGAPPEALNIKTVRYSVEIDGQVQKGSIALTDTIKLNFPWSDRVQTIELDYENQKGLVVGEHYSEISDGIIIEESIILGR